MKNREIKNEHDPLMDGSVQSFQEKEIEKERSGVAKKTLFLHAFVMIAVSSIFGAVAGLFSSRAAVSIYENISRKFTVYFPEKARMMPQGSSEATVQHVVVEDSAVVDAVKKSTPAVVSIIISKDAAMRQSFNPFLNPFFEDSSPQEPKSSSGKMQVGGGTGFFVSSDGMILTNKHVVDDTTADYSVIMNDQKEYPAKVLARDPAQDLAIIKIEGDGFPVLPLGNSSDLQIGQSVIAIGNSLGEFANSVSKGIVSGLKRTLTAGSQYTGATEQLTNIIQTDAAINLGNSGGPLIDISGNVVGINVAKAQGADSVGFALPVDRAKRIIDQVKKTGKISVPFLGIRYMPIDASLQKANQLQFDYGALVQRGSMLGDLGVIPGSSADKAGIVENDIILEVNGEKVDAENQLGDLITKYDVDDAVTLKVFHKGEIRDVSVTLQERK